MYQCIGGTSPKVCLLRRVPRHNHANALSLPAQRCSGSRIDMYKIRRICIFERALPPSCAGQPAPPLFWYLDAKFPRPARMEPSFTGHGGSGCHVKKRSRDADGHMKDSATAGSCVVPFHASPSIWLECTGGSEV